MSCSALAITPTTSLSGERACKTLSFDTKTLRCKSLTKHVPLLVAAGWQCQSNCSLARPGLQNSACGSTISTGLQQTLTGVGRKRSWRERTLTKTCSQGTKWAIHCQTMCSHATAPGGRPRSKILRSVRQRFSRCCTRLD